MVILTSSWNNYSHFLVEHLTKLVIISHFQEYFQTNEIVLVVENDCPDWKLDLIAAVSPIKYQILEIDKFTNLKGSYFITTYPSYNFNLLSSARDLIIKHFEIQPTGKEKRLYLSRKFAKVRRVLNDDEVARFLSSRGFIVVYPECLTLEQQVNLFIDAKIVIGPHGSAFANTLFCRDVRVIEMFPGKIINTMFFGLSTVLDFSYYSMAFDVASPDNGKDSDFFVDLGCLEQQLAMII
ncbi:glycosyltransferase family 61 protein [Amylibacter sp.]|nr:glycosyltransferase family 61 protein [Amylibacter sp.]